MMSKVCLVGAVCLLLLSGSAARAEDGLDALRNQAATLMRQHKAAEAAKIMEGIVDQQPLSAKDHYMYGETLYMLKKYMESALEFKQARNIQPSETVYSARCAEAYLSAGKKEEALAMCDLGLAQCNTESARKALESLKKLSTKGISFLPLPRQEMEVDSSRGGGHR
jgi:predicted Zn-dependent protease